MVMDVRFSTSVWQKFELAVQPFHEARNIISDFEVLGFGTEAFQSATIGGGQICPPLMEIGFVLF
jgi:hypothetical protein